MRAAAWTSLALGGAGVAAAAWWMRRGLERPAPASFFLRLAATIQESPERLYELWRDPVRHGAFLRHARIEADPEDARRWIWRRRLPSGREVRWLTEFTEERPGRLLSWESRAGSGAMAHWFHARASLHFAPRPGAPAEGAPPSTEVHFRLELMPASHSGRPSRAGARLLPLLRGGIERAAADALFRFKQFAETGEVATTEGQPSGRRTALVRELEPLDRPLSPVQRLRGIG